MITEEQKVVAAATAGMKLYFTPAPTHIEGSVIMFSGEFQPNIILIHSTKRPFPSQVVQKID